MLLDLWPQLQRRGVGGKYVPFHTLRTSSRHRLRLDLTGHAWTASTGMRVGLPLRIAAPAAVHASATFTTGLAASHTQRFDDDESALLLLL